MNGFMICFGIIGIIASLFAIVVLAIYVGSFIVVAIKSFKESCKANTEVYKEHIRLLADARKARLQKAREQKINRKNELADKKLEQQKKQILLENQKAAVKDKIKEAKYQKSLEATNKKIENINKKKNKKELEKMAEKVEEEVAQTEPIVVDTESESTSEPIVITPTPSEPIKTIVEQSNETIEEEKVEAVVETEKENAEQTTTEVVETSTEEPKENKEPQQMTFLTE